MKFAIYLIVGFAIVVGGLYAYPLYRDDIHDSVYGTNSEYRIYIDSLAVDVSVADDTEERKIGLSGTKSLRDLEGKLFIFDEADNHGIWMKDMLFPIDIIWIDNNLEIVHIEKNVAPETFPKIFAPGEPARFVLEMNSFFTDTYKINVGDKLTLPPGIVPLDIDIPIQ